MLDETVDQEGGATVVSCYQAKKEVQIADRMVDVPARVQVASHAQLRPGGGLKLGLVICHMGQNNWAHGNLTGNLGKEGLAGRCEQMQSPQLGLQGMLGGADKGVSMPMERADAIGEGHGANMGFQGHISLNGLV